MDDGGTVRRIRFGFTDAEPIAQFESRGVAGVHVAAGNGAAQIYALHFEAGGEIGPHPAGFDQLFLVVAGDGWLAGADGRRHELKAGEGAVVKKGEVHSKGGRSVMTAIMIQVDRLESVQ